MIDQENHKKYLHDALNAVKKVAEPLEHKDSMTLKFNTGTALLLECLLMNTEPEQLLGLINRLLVEGLAECNKANKPNLRIVQ